MVQELLGKPAVKLLAALDDSNVHPTRLRALLLELHPPQSLLARPDARAAICELLSHEEASELASLLGLGAERTPHAALYEARFTSKSSRYAPLLGFFQLPLHEHAESEPSPALSTAAGGHGLFGHQREALKRLRSLAATPPRRVVLHMPTGSGKTRTTMNFIAEHLRVNEPTVVFWLASSEELCEQAASSFSETWTALGNREVEVRRFWGGRDADPRSLGDGVVVASIASVRSRHLRDSTWMAWAGEKTSLIVMDEAHQAVAPTFSFVLEAMLARSPEAALIGLTATPGRTWNDVNADQRLADFFRRKKVTLEVPGYDNPVEHLIEAGYLARPEFRTLEIDTGTLTDADHAKLSEDLDVPEHILSRLADDEKRSIRILRSVADLARRHRRIILFATTAAHAERLAAVLQADGTPARSITARTPSEQRRGAVHWFKSPSDEVRVLTNYGVLTAGFDAPRTSAALIARPTKSLVLFSQMVGRATRGPRAGGNSTAEILTVVDTCLPGFGNMEDAFRNWEDVWQ